MTSSFVSFGWLPQEASIRTTAIAVIFFIPFNFRFQLIIFT